MQSTFGDALEELIRLTPYLFKIFDEDLIHKIPEISAKERFHIIKRLDCVKIPIAAAITLAFHAKTNMAPAPNINEKIKVNIRT